VGLQDSLLDVGQTDGGRVLFVAVADCLQRSLRVQVATELLPVYRQRRPVVHLVIVYGCHVLGKDLDIFGFTLLEVVDTICSVRLLFSSRL